MPAAAVIDDQDLDGVRNELKSLRKGKTKSIHWRYERRDRQPMLAAAWWLNGDGESWRHLEAVTQIVEVDA